MNLLGAREVEDFQYDPEDVDDPTSGGVAVAGHSVDGWCPVVFVGEETRIGFEQAAMIPAALSTTVEIEVSDDDPILITSNLLSPLGTISGAWGSREGMIVVMNVDNVEDVVLRTGDVVAAALVGPDEQARKSASYAMIDQIMLASMAPLSEKPVPAVVPPRSSVQLEGEC